MACLFRSIFGTTEKSSSQEPKTLSTQDNNSLSSKVCYVFHSVINGLFAAFDYVYAKNPVTSERQIWFLPKFAEQVLGDSLYRKYITEQGGETYEHDWAKDVDEVGQNLAKHTKRKFNYEFTVIRSGVVNAWALPGGKIGIYEGLLRAIYKQKIDGVDGFNDLTPKDKLAAVLSHEVTHSDARHSSQRIERTILIDILLLALKTYLIFKEIIVPKKDPTDEEPQRVGKTKRKTKTIQIPEDDPIVNFVTKLFVNIYLLAGSRKHEYEADKFGMYKMKEAGYNPRAAIWLQKYFITQQYNLPGWIRFVLEFFSTHPDSKKRLLENEKTLIELNSSK